MDWRLKLSSSRFFCQNQEQTFTTQEAESLMHVYTENIKGAVVAQLLRCCATNRKVAGSVEAGVIGILPITL